MGYMGFGMRKIDYTRKPQKAFNKVKQVYGKELSIPKSNLNIKDTSNQKYTQKSGTNTWHRKSRKVKLIFSFILCLGFCLTIIWFFILKDKYLAYQQKQFETESIVDFYQSDLKEVQEVFEFLESRTDKIIKLDYRNYSKRFTIRLKHPTVVDDYNSNEVRFVSFQGNMISRLNSDQIIDDELKITRNGFLANTYQNHWIYLLDQVAPKQIPKSVPDYLDATVTEFNHLLTNIKLLKQEIKLRKNLVSTSFDHPDFGTYHIVYIKEGSVSVKTLYGSNNYYSGKIADNIYWLKYISAY